jgi:Tol biopolymer transport system component
LLAVSPAGQAAVLLGVSHPWVLADPSGMLAEVPVTGGTPRELVANVNWADWSPSGELMIVRRVGGQSRLEFPIDHVLYQTTGWIAYPRISPSGDAIAFWDNPMRGDVGGPLILTTTTTGNTRMLTGGLAAQGLAWTPDGREVWFTARDPEVGQWVLWAVNRNGIRRQVWRVPGDLLIQDIANDGRVLLTIEKHRFSMAAAGPARPQQDFSLFEYSLIFDISSDGKQLLFADTTGGSATSSAVYMRQIDTNNAPLRLGSGGVAALSPDGQWVAALSEEYEHLGLIPTHAGNTRNLPRGTIERYATVTWLPDARHLVFVGNEPHHDRRYFLQDVAGGLAQPITPEGVSSYFYWPSISRDGRYVAALTNDGKPIAYPIAGGPARAIPGARVGDVPTRMWYPDGHSLLVYRPDEQPATVYRVDLASAIRVPVRQYMPNDSTGVEWVGPILFSQDFHAYGFSYCRDLSSLYLVSGLK